MKRHAAMKQLKFDILINLFLDLLGGGTGGGETDGGLEGTVDEPLKTGEGTDHDNTRPETSPESLESDSGGLGGTRVDDAHLLANSTGGLDLVDLGDHGISGVRDGTAENTGEVTRSEDNSEVLDLVHLSLGLGAHAVDNLGDTLESDELDDRVRDLTGPEGHETSVQRAGSLGGKDLGESVHETDTERGVGLDTHLDGLEGAEGNIGDELGTGRRSHVHKGTVLGGVLVTNRGGDLVLEVLVETELAGTLERVADEGGAPSTDNSLETRVETEVLDGTGVDVAESSNGGGEVLGVGLRVTLDEIKRGHSSVGKTTGQDSTDGASSEVLARVKFNRHDECFCFVLVGESCLVGDKETYRLASSNPLFFLKHTICCKADSISVFHVACCVR